jgi:hypothetical protein
VTEISVEIQKKNPILPYKWRTAIEWDYGILPPSSIKGLPTDKNVKGSRRDHLSKGDISCYMPITLLKVVSSLFYI